ncbi:hypothetical protein [Streptomyces sp. PsTaAH-124]|uniref:hypothetical protein n=1 Tax=Streptomyces sp. PsTaAH-124 TaxID=1157638 RepID=UPI00037ACBDA|nr:hypothetical protein [Streptomyces sp. PsTaAH-124]
MEVPERPSSAPERAPDRPPRRLRRTLLLVAAAAVLGVVAGTCTGYAVQAHRPPTPLPPLSQPVVERAKGEAEPLPGAQDRRVKTDGDLRKLLVDRPKGAKDGRLAPTGDGWLGLLEYADEFTSPKKAFSNNIAQQFRRAAVVRWETDGTHQVEVRLVQYRQEEELTAEDSAEGDIYWADRETRGHRWPIPGTGAGMAFADTEPDRKPGYVPVYGAEAHAWRGDIVMEIYVYDTKPITKKEIMSLAERQMGRL